MKVKAIDLFCGIGGLTCGLNQSGINVVAGIDLDPSCKYAYETYNHADFLLADITQLTGDHLNRYFLNADFTVLAGCAPCQPFSKLQQEHKRMTHKSWPMLNEYLRLIEEMHPDIVSMENVPDLERKDIFEHFVGQLKELGYSVNYKIIDAATVGVPQRRRRLIFLASLLGDIQFAKYPEKHVTVADTISKLPPLMAGKTDPIDPLHTCSSLGNANLERIRHSTPGGTWRDWPAKLLPNCYKRTSGQTYTSVYGRMSWDEPAPTLTTQFNNYGTGRYGHPEQDRAISIREGALLQSFPVDYPFLEPEGKTSIKVLARQIGNALPPLLGKYIGHSIQEHLKEQTNV
ncbi:DNA cytosine methyltransferase [Peptococcus niger]|uniref:DNA (cytosine-5-)-methyltransferase n=1 Tax=Peptococcus niger TaxID=2741 RepID=A0A1G6W162_PEPNI|nr:DNA cytosine methyltransferase [Peptococcus niger]SDD58765.1 DNA (cytosine-5)-methyltransferase 1 [Peptococcus niger]